MPRIRTIKPELPQSESMGNVSRDARLCFILLWTLADDEGRLRGNSRMLASLLFPYDNDAPALISSWLEELSREGCIEPYQVDGASYVQIANWLSHQKIDRPSSSKLPPPSEGSRVLAKPREASPLDQGPRTKDQGRDQGEDREGEKPSRKRESPNLIAKPDDVTEQTWSDWMQLRKSKKAPVTETVVSGARSESVKAGLPLEKFLQVWCTRGSQGLQADWLKPDERGRPKAMGSHTGFDSTNYSEGINDDLTFD